MSATSSLRYSRATNGCHPVGAMATEFPVWRSSHVPGVGDAISSEMDDQVAQADQVKDYSRIYKEPMEDDGQEEVARDTVKVYQTEGTPFISHSNSFSDLRILNSELSDLTMSDINHNQSAASSSYGPPRPPRSPFKSPPILTSAKPSLPPTAIPRLNQAPNVVIPPSSDDAMLDTPLIFSRVSPVDSISDEELNGKGVGDHDEVESEFSCEVSKAVSPSDLPSSPGEDMPVRPAAMHMMPCSYGPSHHPTRRPPPGRPQPPAPAPRRSLLNIHQASNHVNHNQMNQVPQQPNLPPTYSVPKKMPPPVPPKPSNLISSMKSLPVIPPPEGFGNLLPDIDIVNQLEASSPDPPNDNDIQFVDEDDDDEVQKAIDMKPAPSEIRCRSSSLDERGSDDDDDYMLLEKCISKGIRTITSNKTGNNNTNAINGGSSTNDNQRINGSKTISTPDSRNSTTSSKRPSTEAASPTDYGILEKCINMGIRAGGIRTTRASVVPRRQESDSISDSRRTISVASSVSSLSSRGTSHNKAYLETDIDSILNYEQFLEHERKARLAQPIEHPPPPPPRSTSSRKMVPTPSAKQPHHHHPSKSSNV